MKMAKERKARVSEMRTMRDVVERVYSALSVANKYTIENVGAERSLELISEIEAKAKEEGLVIPSYYRSFEDRKMTFFYGDNGIA